MYRNKQLLQLAQYAPVCMRCGKINQGDVVAAHSNQLRDGKGTGIKAHDFRIAYLCHSCHMDIDQERKMNKAEKQEAWEEAHRKSIEWLFLSGCVEIKGEGNEHHINDRGIQDNPADYPEIRLCCLM